MLVLPMAQRKLLRLIRLAAVNLQFPVHIFGMSARTRMKNILWDLLFSSTTGTILISVLVTPRQIMLRLSMVRGCTWANDGTPCKTKTGTFADDTHNASTNPI